MNRYTLAVFTALSAIALAPVTASAQNATYSTAVGGAIPDKSSIGINSTISVADSYAVDPFVSITITGLQHTFVGQLIITLTHGGKTVDIIDRVKGGGNVDIGDQSDLNGDYTFVTTGGADFNAAADQGGTFYIIPSNVNYATLPVGLLNPKGGVSNANGLLSDFNGMDMSGDWTLNIADRDDLTPMSSTGSFTGWRFVMRDPSQINTNCTISDASFNGLSNLRVGNTTSTDVTLAAGAMVRNVQAFNASRVYMTGGTATSLRSEDTAKLYVNSGTVSGAVTATENSTVFINGGDVGSVLANGNAKAYVLAGTYGAILGSGNSDIYVYGGSVGGGAVFAAAGGASISLFGDNLLMNAGSKTGGTFGGNLGFFYNLSGTLTDGTSLVGSRFFDADGGFSVVGENPGALYLNGVAVVPEAGTFALLGVGVAAFGGLVLAKRGFVTRRKR